MPDKEFDKLFQDNFADAEIAPSKDFWNAIEDKLEPKRKKTFPVFWMAAASVAVLSTAVMVFQKEEKIQLHGNAGEKLAIVVKNEPKAVEEVVNDAKNEVKKKAIATGINRNKAGQSSINLVDNQSIENNLKDFSIAMQPNDANKPLPIKQTDAKPLDVLPKEETVADNQIVYANAGVTKDNSEMVIGETETRSRRNIENVGDLVNLVVDRVDKREKKFIKFNTDDDDNSSIVGINIGILKFNKKNKER